MAHELRPPLPALRASDLLYRRKLGIPWASILLIATCFVVTLPLFIEPRRFYLTLGVGFCEEDGPVRWYHALVTPFVHGAGCGFPPTWFHIGVNVSLFVFQGVLVERLLGSGRYALLTLAGLAVHIPLKYLIIQGRAHGASGMTWSYLLFAFLLLAWMWRAERWRMLRDWATVLLALWVALAVVGLIKHWHLWNVLVSVPFFLAWRKPFRASFEAVARGEAPERGGRAGNIAGVLVLAALFAFNLLFVVLAAMGILTPTTV